MTAPHRSRLACSVLLASLLLLATGCGGGFVDVFYDPIGDVEVDNKTDVTGEWIDCTYFEMVPSGGVISTGNLVPGGVLPGEIVYAGSFAEDWYDAEGVLDSWPIPSAVIFYDEFVEGGFTTTFEVF